MRFFSITVLSIVLTSMVATDALGIASRVSKAPVYHREHQRQKSQDVDEIIYDLTIPWPFRRPNRDVATVAEEPEIAVAPRAVIDTDGDGVPDDLDQCPDTPHGAIVDAMGCPSDSDGDGVYNGIDQCPSTPAGTPVDDVGCPLVIDAEEQLIDTGMIRTSLILFETAKSDIKIESRPVLDEIGRTLTDWVQLEIEISGHTDSRGSDAYNQGLSERRAAAVMEYLVANFPAIRAERFTSVGHGERRPVASNDTTDGMAKNRRVEFAVLNEEMLQAEIRRGED